MPNLCQLCQICAKNGENCEVAIGKAEPLPPILFFIPSAGRPQLAFGIDAPENVHGEFTSEAMMGRLCDKLEIHLDAEAIESFRNHLNDAACRQLQQPIKHIKTARSEIFIYLDTWGVIRSADGHLRSGIHVWDDSANALGSYSQPANLANDCHF